MTTDIDAGLPRPRTLLFDWDNTLVDSWQAIHHAINTTLSAMGQATWTLDDTRARVRKSAREAFPEWFGDRAEEAARVFYRTFEADHLAQLTPCAGAAEMLAVLAEAGYDLAVISNKQGPYLRAEAAQLGWTGYFRRLVGANDAARDKPDPAAVHLALENESPNAGTLEKVWLVGDTDIDLLCARNAGCVPVLLRADTPQPGEFPSAPPRLHLESCAALAALLAAPR